MRGHAQTGDPVRVVVSRGLRDSVCSLCSNRVTVGVRASAPPIPYHHMFCRLCAAAIGRVAGAIGHRPKTPKKIQGATL